MLPKAKSFGAVVAEKSCDAELGKLVRTESTQQTLFEVRSARFVADQDNTTSMRSASFIVVFSLKIDLQDLQN